MGGDDHSDVFFSYTREDRSRVEPLVAAVEARGLTVWWDVALEVGDRWREVIEDRLDHAQAVCVVWTRSSVDSTFVRDEASRAHRRGVLVPLCLDPVQQPLGFGELHCADLTGPGDLTAPVDAVVSRIAELATRSVPVDRSWESELERTSQRAFYGASEARGFLDRVRALADMFAANPGAAASLQGALGGIRDTHEVVLEVIGDFLEPADEGGPVTIERYRRLAEGRLVPHIQRRRGHCKQIAQSYIVAGGLRDSLPDSVGSAMREELDELVLSLSNADDDVFDAMAAVGRALESQAAVITNLLLADQRDEARARLAEAEATLRPLRRQVSDGMGEVERLAAELGVPATG